MRKHTAGKFCGMNPASCAARTYLARDWCPVLRIGWSNVIRPRTYQSIVVQLLDDVGRPATDARHSENWRKQIYVNSERVISGGRIEVHIGVQLLLAFYEFLDSV